MRIEQLEYLAAVTRHGSLRKAGEARHISQPALSEAITKLERELGVRLLDRPRSGARISRHGRDLMPDILGVLDAVDRLRAAAGSELSAARVLRVGTVNAATSGVLVPAIRDFHSSHPGTTVELHNLPPDQVHAQLLDGAVDVGLVNVLPGDDTPVGMVESALVRGRPVVVCRTDHPFAARRAVLSEELRSEPVIAMRSGYLMHRYLHRLLGSELGAITHTADGADLGKHLVAEGVGVTVLPDFSVIGDPLERAGLVTWRPIEDDETIVTLMARRRRTDRIHRDVRDLEAALASSALRYAEQRAEAGRPAVARRAG